MRLRIAATLVLLLVGGTGPLSAQERASSGFTGIRDGQAPAPPAPPAAFADSVEENPELMTVYGVLLGGGGLFAGALLGYSLESSFCDPCHEYSGFFGGILGATLGESLGLAAGVHLGNQRRGSLGRDLIVATAVGAAGVAAAIRFEQGFVLWLTPVAQLLATTAVERAHR